VTVRALHFHADGRDEHVDLGDWTMRSLPKDELLWIDILAPDADDLEAVRGAVDLADRTVAMLGEEPSRPDAVVLEDGVSVVVSAPGDELDADPVELRILVGSDWVVTCHPDRIGFLEDRLERVRDEREVGLLTPVQFLVSLLEWHLDAFFRVAAQLESAVDALDDAALRTERDLLQKLVRMRRRIADIRRHLGAHREVFAELARPDLMPGLDERELQALSAMMQRFDRATDAVANAREMLIGTFDVHMTRTAQRTNDIMKVLTLASAILLPASVIAGVMGMNFQVGFFDNPDLFWIVLAGMLAVALGTIAFARWRGWL
jgi:magnesium transporter